MFRENACFRLLLLFKNKAHPASRSKTKRLVVKLSHFLTGIQTAREFVPSLTAKSVEKVLKSETVTFLIVRHPLDRLVSAFRDKVENRANFRYYRRKMNLTGGRPPDFRTFVRKVLDGLEDDHWSPVNLSCSPCQVPKKGLMFLNTHFLTLYLFL